MPKMKTKSGAKKRFKPAPAAESSGSGVQAPHPDQEDHQVEAPAARHDRSP